MKIRFILPIILSLVSFCPLVWSAPEILNYSGRITVSGEPYSGQGYFKFALVNRGGTISYWTNDGNYTLVQEPASAVATQVNGGVYSVQLGDGALANMQAIPGQIFKDHNDVHLRIWFAQSASGPFDLLSLPIRQSLLCSYSLKWGGSTSVSAGSGSTVQQTTVVEGGRVLTTGDLVRLVATGPANPSQTLILLAGDEVDIVTYSAGSACPSGIFFWRAYLCHSADHGRAGNYADPDGTGCDSSYCGNRSPNPCRPACPADGRACPDSALRW